MKKKMVYKVYCLKNPYLFIYKMGCKIEIPFEKSKKQ